MFPNLTTHKKDSGHHRFCLRKRILYILRENKHFSIKFGKRVYVQHAHLLRINPSTVLPDFYVLFRIDFLWNRLQTV